MKITLAGSINTRAVVGRVWRCPRAPSPRSRRSRLASRARRRRHAGGGPAHRVGARHRAERPAGRPPLPPEWARVPNVFTVGQEKRLTRWDLRDQNFLEAVDLSDDQSDEASCVAVSNSGLVVATGGTKKLLKLYETAPGHKLLASVVGHSGAIRDLKFSPDDKQLVTVGEDGVIFVWNLYVD